MLSELALQLAVGAMVVDGKASAVVLISTCTLDFSELFTWITSGSGLSAEERITFTIPCYSRQRPYCRLRLWIRMKLMVSLFLLTNCITL